MRHYLVICGPVCANIVVYMLEKKWLCIHRPIVYRRFIDDVALVSSQLIDLDSFRKVFGSLRLNIEFGNEIHFLDLKIIYDPTYRRISTSLYIKPTNTFSYLSVNSNHKSSIFKNIPFSLLIRVRRSCSEDFDFFFFSRLLVSQLKKRGYCHYFLMNVVRRVSNLNRKTLLPYKKNKSLSNSKNKNFFVMPFNNSNIDINRIIYNSFNSFINLYKLDNFKIKVVNSVNNNLRRIFIHNCNLSMKNFNFKCFKCNLTNCRCCNFFSDKSIIDFGESFSLPILSNSNCKSKFCIYIINCTFCNSFYVGETIQTLEKRLDAHLSNIRCFSPFNKEYSEVAFHFRKKGHDYRKHLKISIFASDVANDNLRLDIESELIHLFLTFGCKVINAKLLKHIERFCSDLT